MLSNHDLFQGCAVNLSELTLLELLNGSKPHFFTLEKNDPQYLAPKQMANLYTNSAFLTTVMEFLEEQRWLRSEADKVRGEETSYSELISPLFGDELAPIVFLRDFLIESGPEKIKEIYHNSQVVVAKALALVRDDSNAEKKDFVVETLKAMTTHFVDEEERQTGRVQSQGHKGPRLYRTFDSLDQIFNLDYGLDRDMVIDNSAVERLYQGSGVGVQSGYSTILLALDSLDMDDGSKVIDLGSGFGRVGLVFSLLRPDIEFTGYEYVPHRVENSNETCETFGLQESLAFKVQDLSLDSFVIPEADVYYFYDPFTRETYEKVLGEVVEVSRRKEITIVTKGNARGWLVDVARKNAWPDPVSLDEGNLCIFKSC